MTLHDHAIESIEELAAGHVGQHRCTDGVYYRPDQAAECPVRIHLALIDTARGAAIEAPHNAVHDPDVITDVAAAMVSGPLDDLDPEQQEAWRSLARLGLEEFCRLLDARRASDTL